jgi:hypothetical protein
MLKSGNRSWLTYLDLPPLLPQMEQMTLRPIHIIGGGLAGSEAAWQIA